MHTSAHSDPAERLPLMRLFYRGWRPTRLGRLANRVAGWLSALGVSPDTARLEVPGRATGRIRRTPVVIATFEGKQYLVSMLGPGSAWVKNVDAAGGEAVLRQGRPRRVRLVAIPPIERAPILKAYVRVATSGRHHFPVPVDAALSEFEQLVDRYPVYRIDFR